MSKKLGILTIILILLATATFWAIKNQVIDIETKEPESEVVSETLLLKGSNTVGESFAPKLAEAYLKSIGARLIKTTKLESPVEKYVEGTLIRENRKIRIDIRAHGSSTGFKALDEKSTEIAMSSRAIKSKEQTNLSQKFGSVTEHPIALDALAIVTHPNNPIDNLTIDQIAKIFSGEITNWQEIGGNDQSISLFSRDDKSGTWDTFKSLVLKPFDKKLSENSARFESSNELVENVTNTPGALGFVGVAYVKKSKLLSVSVNTQSLGSKPSGYTIGTQKYPLSRKLYFYTTGEKLSPLASEFINFVSKNEGQKLAEQVGLISYYPTHYQPEQLDKLTADRYRELAAIGRRITVNFATLETTADKAKEERDIQRLKNYIDQNSHRKIVLVDFSNSPRTAELASKLSNQQIQVLDTINIQDLNRTEDNIEVWAL